MPLAEYAVENCGDITEMQNANHRMLQNHLLSLLPYKPKAEQKKLANDISARFMAEARKYYISRQAQINGLTTLKKPVPITTIELPKVDKEQLAQKNILTAILSKAVPEKIKLLEQNLKYAETEQEKNEIQQEILYWKSN